MKEKIIQITTDGSFNGRIFGLSELGMVYIWISKIAEWLPYTEENKHKTSN